MSQSSIHIEGGKIRYFAHNSRERETKNTIFKDEENYYSCLKSEAIETFKKELKERQKKYKDAMGRKLHSKTLTHMSAIVNFNKEHTADDIKKVCDYLEQKFDTKIIQYAMHRDEGHVNSEGKPIKNYHAHIEFMGLDSQGNSVRRKLDRKTLIDLQSKVAEILNMERGNNKKARRLDTYDFKQFKERESQLLKEIEKEKEKNAQNYRRNIGTQQNDSDREIDERKQGIQREFGGKKDETQRHKRFDNALERLSNGREERNRSDGSGSSSEPFRKFADMQRLYSLSLAGNRRVSRGKNISSSSLPKNENDCIRPTGLREQTDNQEMSVVRVDKSRKKEVFKSLRSELKELKAERKDYAELEQMQKDLLAKDLTIDEFKKEIEKYKEKIKDLEGTYRSQVVEIGGLDIRIEELSKENSKLKTDLQTLTLQNNELKADTEITEETKEYEELSKENSKLKTDLQTLTLQNNELILELKKLTSEINDLIDKNNKLEADTEITEETKEYIDSLFSRLEAINEPKMAQKSQENSPKEETPKEEETTNQTQIRRRR